ncbi:fibulin-2 isoform X3 [Protopterus annectens]|uniref:fibulin-2 isoform X3 n=1 Tax=Protopterus annectens TaxID=7888 RepID=UPI001CF9EA8F|nr:fibulin-2 isoform X3 [Protopterus annectens]
MTMYTQKDSTFTVLNCVMYVLIWSGVSLAQKDCTGTECPLLENCIEEVLEPGECCASCLQQGCTCEGYQYYDCVHAGFRNGKVPEGKSYFVDFGSTECLCPLGGGKIMCHFIPCPELPSNCIEVIEPHDGCHQCGKIGCIKGEQKYEAGHTFKIPPCQVCHCPSDGGQLMCYPLPGCDPFTLDPNHQPNNDARAPDRHYDDPYSYDQEVQETDLVHKEYTNSRNDKPLLHKPNSRHLVKEYEYTESTIATPSLTDDVLPTNSPFNMAPRPGFMQLSEATGEIEIKETDQDGSHSTTETLDTLNEAETESVAAVTEALFAEEVTESEELVTGGTPTEQEFTETDQMPTQKNVEFSKTEKNETFHHSRSVVTPQTVKGVENTKRTGGLHANEFVFPTIQFSPTTRSPVALRNVDNHVSQKLSQTLSNYEPGEEEEETGDDAQTTASESSHQEEVLPSQPSILKNQETGDARDTFDKDLFDDCCAAGYEWAAENGQCNNIPVNNLYAVICRVVQEQCCSSYLKDTSCIAGMIAAKEGEMCVAEDKDACGADHLKICCDCCSLGLTAKSNGLVCEPYPNLGYLCNQLYLTCCEGSSQQGQPEIRKQPEPTPTPQLQRLSEADHSNEAFFLNNEDSVTDSIPADYSDECLSSVGLQCEHHCIRNAESYVCSCNPGFYLAADGFSCHLYESVARVEDEEFNYLERTEHTSEVKSFADSVTEGVHIEEDKCKDLGPCKHHCNVAKGSIVCSCFSGYVLMNDSYSCEDIDECAIESHTCQPAEQCVNTVGSFLCRKIICRIGYRLQNDTCEDINECAVESHTCQPSENCINTPGSFICQKKIICHPGYRLQNEICEDIDECTVGLHNCTLDTVCENTPGSFYCKIKHQCTQGFSLNPEGGCVDINECVTESHTCQPTEDCINTVGSFTCQKKLVCKQGYTLQDGNCEDIDECTRGLHNCPQNTVCENTPGSFYCERRHQCMEGFTVDPEGVCIDINECTALTDPCKPGFNCINTAGSYTCQRNLITCNRGYVANSDGTGCVDVDECQTGIHRCDEGQFCQNLPGAYRCDCKPGYQYDAFSRRCVDINECWRYPGRLCAHTCENTPGSYKCTCTSGFRLAYDGKNCEDVNECERNPCSQECANIYGSYQCYCRQGYQLMEDGQSCKDIDECTQGLGTLCLFHCVNVPGSYQCACPEHGYTMAPNGRTCKDIDECSLGTHNCTSSETCFNIQGNYKCLLYDCPANYKKVSDMRCERISCLTLEDCQNTPLRITYYQLTFPTNVLVPATIFRIGPSPVYAGDNIFLSITKGNEEQYFSTRRLNSYTGMVYLQRQVMGPRDFILDVEMKLWRQGTLTTFIAKIYVFITEHAF